MSRLSLATAILFLIAAGPRTNAELLVPLYSFDSTLTNIRDIAYDQSTGRLIAHRAWGYGGTGLAVIDASEAPSGSRVVGSIAAYNNGFAPLGSLDYTTTNIPVGAIPAGTLLFLMSDGNPLILDHLEAIGTGFHLEGFAENSNVAFAVNPNDSARPIVCTGLDATDGQVIRAVEPLTGDYEKLSLVPTFPPEFVPAAIDFGPETGHLYIVGSSVLYEIDYQMDSQTLNIVSEFDLELPDVTVAGLAFDDSTGQFYVAANSASGEGRIYCFPALSHETPEPASVIFLLGGLLPTWRCYRKPAALRR